MKKYKVTFYKRRNGRVVKSIVVESKDDHMLISKATKLLESTTKFKFDHKLHTAGYRQIKNKC